jgi:hypothetical protein
MRFQKFAVVLIVITAISTAANAQKAVFDETVREPILHFEEAKSGTQDDSYAVGRVTDLRGRSVRSAAITLYCIDSDQVRRVATNTFGYYRFESLAPGNYLISIEHRSYLFLMGSLSFLVEDKPVEIDFRAERLR